MVGWAWFRDVTRYRGTVEARREHAGAALSRSLFEVRWNSGGGDRVEGEPHTCPGHEREAGAGARGKTR